MAAEEPLWESYPPQVQEAPVPTTVVESYQPPAADVPDEVEFAVPRTWRSYLLSLVSVLFLGLVTFIVARAISVGSGFPDAGVILVLGMLVIAAVGQLAGMLRPTRLNVNGEGLVIKERFAGMKRADVSVPWHAIDAMDLYTRKVRQGKSSTRETALEWRLKPEYASAISSNGSRRRSVELGDVDNDELARVLERYRAPGLTVTDRSGWFDTDTGGGLGGRPSQRRRSAG